MGCVIASLMVLEEFGVEIAPYFGSCQNSWFGLWFGVNTSSEIISGLLLLENQYRVGDVVSFDNASGTVKEIIYENNFTRSRRNCTSHSAW
jgi:small conductance mechanosensitive channel